MKSRTIGIALAISFSCLLLPVFGKPGITCGAEARWFSESFFTVKCPSGCKQGDGWVFGSATLPYSGWSSICLAAIHNSSINANVGGWVTVIKQASLKEYSNEVKNGIISIPLRGSSDDKAFIVREATALPGMPLEVDGKVSCYDRLQSFLVEPEMIFECPGGCGWTSFPGVLHTQDGLTYGSSSICTAAIEKFKMTDLGGAASVIVYSLQATSANIISYLDSTDFPADLFYAGIKKSFLRKLLLQKYQLDLSTFKYSQSFGFADLPTSCEEGRDRWNAGKDGGVYWVCANTVGRCFQVYCEFSDNGAWIVMQRRVDGSENFDRPYIDYLSGFGHLTGNFWIGLQTLREFTSNSEAQLRIDIKDWNGLERFATYDNFLVGPGYDNYALRVGNYSGDAGDSLSCSNFAPFTTSDNLNGITSDINCGALMRAGWWFTDCGESNLNGVYATWDEFAAGESVIAPPAWGDFPGIANTKVTPTPFWATWHVDSGYGWFIPLQFTEMKFKITKFGGDYSTVQRVIESIREK